MTDWVEQRRVDTRMYHALHPYLPPEVHKRGPLATGIDPDGNSDGLAYFNDRDLWVANRRVYGVRKLWHAAKRAGHRWGRDQVARLMRIAGIDGVVRGRRTIETTERDKNGQERPGAAS